MTLRTISIKVFSSASKHADIVVYVRDKLETGLAVDLQNNGGEGLEMHIDPIANVAGNTFDRRGSRRHGRNSRSSVGGFLDIRDSLSRSSAHSDESNDEDDEDDMSDNIEYASARSEEISCGVGEKMSDLEEDVSSEDVESDQEIDEDEDDVSLYSAEEILSDDDESDEENNNGGDPSRNNTIFFDEAEADDSGDSESSLTGNQSAVADAAPETDQPLLRYRSCHAQDDAQHRNDSVNNTASPPVPPRLLQTSPMTPSAVFNHPPQPSTPAPFPPAPPSPSPNPVDNVMSIDSVAPTNPAADVFINEALSGLLNNPLDDFIIQAKVRTTTVNQSRLDFDAIPPQGVSPQDLPLHIDTDEVEEIPRSPPPETIEPELIWFKQGSLYVPFTHTITDMVL